MSHNNNDDLDSFKNKDRLNDEWRKLFSELCYEVFYKNPEGAKLLSILENKYFRSPVANPARDPSWAFFNEGANELIRSFTMGIQAHLSMAAERTRIERELSESLPRKGRARKSAIRPIR